MPSSAQDKLVHHRHQGGVLFFYFEAKKPLARPGICADDRGILGVLIPGLRMSTCGDVTWRFTGGERRVLLALRKMMPIVLPLCPTEN